MEKEEKKEKKERRERRETKERKKEDENDVEREDAKAKAKAKKEKIKEKERKKEKGKEKEKESEKKEGKEGNEENDGDDAKGKGKEVKKTGADSDAGRRKSKEGEIEHEKEKKKKKKKRRGTVPLPDHQNGSHNEGEGGEREREEGEEKGEERKEKGEEKDNFFEEEKMDDIWNVGNTSILRKSSSMESVDPLDLADKEYELNRRKRRSSADEDAAITKRMSLKLKGSFVKSGKVNKEEEVSTSNFLFVPSKNDRKSASASPRDKSHSSKDEKKRPWTLSSFRGKEKKKKNASKVEVCAIAPTDDVLFDEEGNVIGAPAPGLIRYVILCGCEQKRGEFLAGFHDFIPPRELFRICREEYVKSDAAQKNAVYDLLNDWITHYYRRDIHMDRPLFDDILNFVSSSPGGHTNRLKLTILKERSEFREVLKKFKAEKEESGKELSEGNTPRVSETTAAAGNQEEASPELSELKYSIHKRYSAKEIACAITHLAWKSFQLIRFDELIDCAWQSAKADSTAPNLHALSLLFNDVSTIIQEEILVCVNASDRAKAVLNYIKVAEILCDMGDYQSMASICSGLNQSSVSRLKKTWNEVSERDHDTFKKLDAVLSPNSNFKAYKKAYGGKGAPKLPIIANYLREIRFIYDGNPRFLDEEENGKEKGEGEVINFSLLCLIGQRVLSLKQAKQDASYGSLQPDLLLVQFLKNIPYSHSEDELYDISLKCEPPSAAFSSALEDDRSASQASLSAI
eukprot:CAMPEP_0119127940 /NCGR_PEP_ID=MMETSP1310-20130426/6287_1 /TAXON_ID=464262 /ORGANISM="Genus nov. species nov., Strain RCC2339" /LENGTH=742 /DNA_ID=CAMNT_0007118227 /DNA_START=30 /DNA_END=2258 /DNA_ORIENTATION=-